MLRMSNNRGFSPDTYSKDDQETEEVSNLRQVEFRAEGK